MLFGSKKKSTIKISLWIMKLENSFFLINAGEILQTDLLGMTSLINSKIKIANASIDDKFYSI